MVNPVFYDSGAGSNGTGWDSSLWTTLATYSNPITLDHQSNQLHILTGSVGSWQDGGRGLISAPSIPNGEVTCYYTMLDSNEHYPGLVIRSTGDWLSGAGYYPTGGYEFALAPTLGYNTIGKFTSGAEAYLGTTQSFSYSVGNRYGMKIKFQETSLSSKCWDASGAEPAAYDTTITDSSYSSGVVGFYLDGSGSAGQPASVGFDHFSVIDYDHAIQKAPINTIARIRGSLF